MATVNAVWRQNWMGVKHESEKAFGNLNTCELYRATVDLLFAALSNAITLHFGMTRVIERH